MRQMSMEEINSVSGGSFGDYVGAVVGAICGALTRGVGGATVCAVAGVAATDLVDNADFSQGVDAVDYYNSLPPGVQ